MLRVHGLLDKDEIASLGASLRAIDQKILKQSHKAGTNRIWFQGEEPYFDVFLELCHDEIVWFQLTFRGKSLCWHSQKPGFQTGATNELNFDDVNFYSASKTIVNDAYPDLEFIKIVKSIFQTRAEEVIFSKLLELFK